MSLLLCTAALFATSAVAQDNPPAAPEKKTVDLQALLSAFVHSGGENRKVLSIGTPVKAETCRIYDGRAGKWYTKHKQGVAVHLRFRSGGGVVNSSIVFVDGNEIIAAYGTGAVRSSDTRLVK